MNSIWCLAVASDKNNNFGQIKHRGGGCQWGFRDSCEWAKHWELRWGDQGSPWNALCWQELALLEDLKWHETQKVFEWFKSDRKNCKKVQQAILHEINYSYMYFVCLHFCNGMGLKNDICHIFLEILVLYTELHLVFSHWSFMLKLNIWGRFSF